MTQSLGATNSAETLAELAAENSFVIALDDHRRWYRYHHLFAELLRSELERSDPDLARECLSRAAAWYEQDGGNPGEAFRLRASAPTSKLPVESRLPPWTSSHVAANSKPATLARRLPARADRGRPPARARCSVGERAARRARESATVCGGSRGRRSRRPYRRTTRGRSDRHSRAFEQFSRRTESIRCSPTPSSCATPSARRRPAASSEAALPPARPDCSSGSRTRP